MSQLFLRAMFYIEDGSQCHNICGDGFLNLILEQCDDENLLNNDGCNDNYKIDINWKCQQENGVSVCNYVLLPQIILTQLTKTISDNQEFKLSFSQQVRLNIAGISEEQFLQMIIIVIENAKDDDYYVEVRPIISISTEFTDVAYKLLVNFKSKIQDPVLQVTIKNVKILWIFGTTLYYLIQQIQDQSLLVKCLMIKYHFQKKLLFQVESLFISFWLQVLLLFYLVIQKYYGTCLICSNNYNT